MYKPRDEQINNMMDEQTIFYTDEKDSILTELSSIDSELDQTYNEILASILGKDVKDITDSDFPGDKLAYLEYISKDPASSKKISTAKNKIEKHKEKIKFKMIKLLKYKAELYKSNEKLIKELKGELAERQQQAGVLNEEIANEEISVNELTDEIQNTQKYIDDADANFRKDEQKKLDEISALEDAITLKADDDPTLESDNERLKALEEYISSLRKNYYSNKDIQDKRDFVTSNTSLLAEKRTLLSDKRKSLADLQIDARKSAVERVEKDNVTLYNSIGKDIEDYKKVGIDISPEELKVDKSITKEPVARPETKTETTKQDANNIQNTDATQGVVQNIASQGTVKNTSATQGVIQNTDATQGVIQEAPSQATEDLQEIDDDLPISLTPKQIANNLKRQILSGSVKDCYNLLENGSYDDLASSISYFSRSDRKALYKKIKQINSNIDKQKLQGIITALSKTDIIGDFDVDKIVGDNGKLKDFKSMSMDDIDDLNKLMSDIGTNMDSIDPTQLDFLQENLVMNVKSKSLAHSLKPRSIIDLFKSRRQIDNDYDKADCVYELCDTACSFHKDKDKFTYDSQEEISVKKEQPDKFYQALFEQTNDEIQDVTPNQKEEDEPVK